MSYHWILNEKQNIGLIYITLINAAIRQSKYQGCRYVLHR